MTQNAHRRNMKLPPDCKIKTWRIVRTASQSRETTAAAASPSPRLLPQPPNLVRRSNSHYLSLSDSRHRSPRAATHVLVCMYVHKGELCSGVRPCECPPARPSEDRAHAPFHKSTFRTPGAGGQPASLALLQGRYRHPEPCCSKFKSGPIESRGSGPLWRHFALRGPLRLSATYWCSPPGGSIFRLRRQWGPPSHSRNSPRAAGSPSALPVCPARPALATGLSRCEVRLGTVPRRALHYSLHCFLTRSPSPKAGAVAPSATPPSPSPPRLGTQTGEPKQQPYSVESMEPAECSTCIPRSVFDRIDCSEKISLRLTACSSRVSAFSPPSTARSSRGLPVEGGQKRHRATKTLRFLTEEGDARSHVNTRVTGDDEK